MKSSDAKDAVQLTNESRERQTTDCVYLHRTCILLVTLCQVQKLCHSHASQYMKFQEMHASRHLVASCAIFSELAIDSERNSVPILLQCILW